MRSREKPKRKRSKLLWVVLGLALLLAALLRGLGLGPGSGLMDGLKEFTSELKSELTGEPPRREASPEPEALQKAAEAPAECELVLRSEGLTLNGKPATVAEAVDVCRAVGKAHVRATGGARVGEYEELMRGLEQAGVTVDERRRPQGE